MSALTANARFKGSLNGATDMKTAIKVAILTCVITASTVYVLMQRRPTTSRPITIASADAPELSAEEKANIEVYENCSAGVAERDIDHSGLRLLVASRTGGIWYKIPGD